MLAKLAFITFMMVTAFFLAILSDQMEYELTGKCKHCLILNLGNDKEESKVKKPCWKQTIKGHSMKHRVACPV